MEHSFLRPYVKKPDMPHSLITPLTPGATFVTTETETCILSLLANCAPAECLGKPPATHLKQAPTVAKGKAASSGGKLHIHH